MSKEEEQQILDGITVTMDSLCKTFQLVEDLFQLPKDLEKSVCTELALFLMYLCDPDKKVTQFDADVISAVAKMPFSPDEITSVIKEKNLHSPTFTQTVPVTFASTVRLDKVFTMFGAPICLTDLMLRIYGELGGVFAQIDGGSSPEKERDFQRYMDMLKSYVGKQTEGEKKSGNQDGLDFLKNISNFIEKDVPALTKGFSDLAEAVSDLIKGDPDFTGDDNPDFPGDDSISHREDGTDSSTDDPESKTEDRADAPTEDPESKTEDGIDSSTDDPESKIGGKADAPTEDSESKTGGKADSSADDSVSKTGNGTSSSTNSPDNMFDFTDDEFEYEFHSKTDDFEYPFEYDVDDSDDTFDPEVGNVKAPEKER